MERCLKPGGRNDRKFQNPTEAVGRNDLGDPCRFVCTGAEEPSPAVSVGHFGAASAKTAASRLVDACLVVFTWTHDDDVLRGLYVADENVFVFAAIAVLATDVGLHGPDHLGNDEVGRIGA